MAKILVIEDDKIIAAVLERFLTQAGHAVALAHDGKAGAQHFAANPADLVITDMFMPDKDGLEFLREFRTQRPNLPVIAISGGGSVPAGSVLTMARMLGAREVLQKPIRAKELVEAVDRCFAPAA